MKKTFWFGIWATLACSSGSNDAPEGQPPSGSPPVDQGTDEQSDPSQRPPPGQVPTLPPPPEGIGGGFTPPDFPAVDGSGFTAEAFPSSTCTQDCTDFPEEPLVEAGGGPPIGDADIAAFGDPDTFAAGNLCVTEPQLSADGVPGAMFPANWLRPRFRWAGGGGVFEVRLQNEIERSDLVVYTRGNEWVMPQEIWESVARNVHTPITVTIRSAQGGTVSGTRGSFEIAPVNAGGSLVFWSTTTAEVRAAPQLRSRLYGFAVGEEAVRATLDPTQIELDELVGEDGVEPRGTYAEADATQDVTGYPNGNVACVGCHISTPDGASVVFTDNWPWNKLVASISEDSVGERPGFMTDGAQLLLSQPWLGTQTMSPAFFGVAGRYLVTSYGLPANANARPNPWDATVPARHRLAWFDLAADVSVVDRLDIPQFAGRNENENDNPNDDIAFPETVADLQQIPPNPVPQGVPRTLGRGELSVFRQFTVAAARGTGWDLLPMTGEPDSAVTPDWSHDGATIAYVSTDVTSADGHPDWTANEADIRLVPFAGRQGGASTPLAGASSPNFLEYYPAFSSDDALIAFTRAPNPSNPNRTGCTPATDPGCRQQALGDNPDGPYYNRNGEIFVVSSEGGTAIRLAANDPVACTGATSRGSINSWPKWSPRAETRGGLRYYFLVFSSARPYEGSFSLPTIGYTPPISTDSAQLYMATIVVDQGSGEVTTYPAIYLWNQNREIVGGNVVQRQGSNLTPAWDEFLLPPIVIQ